MKSTCIIMLGQNGDILNVLPIARRLAIEHGQPTPFFVSRHYLPLLKGVTYVLPEPVSFPTYRVDLALKLAESKYERVLFAQVWGKYYQHPAQRPDGVAYNLAAWLNCGFTKEDFYDTARFPLVLDRRDKHREAFLIERMVKRSQKPVILYNFGCSKSSPFHSHYVMKSAIEERWSKHCTCVNLCNAKAARLYDLLGLMDMASILLTVDSATLHLAAASSVPVIALVNNDPWRGSAIRCNVRLAIRYDDALKSVRKIHEEIAHFVHTSRPETSSLEIEQPPFMGASPSASAIVNS